MNMLPSDRYLCSLLGISEEEFIEFKAAARRHLKENPIEGPVAGTGTEVALALAIANLVIGLGAVAVSLLLRPSIPKQKQPGQINTVDISQDPVQSNTSFAPRYGFESVQAVTKLGEVIPLIYCNRNVGGDKVGGVRVNMPMIWSQVLSFGTSQMLRAVFLVGEAEIGNSPTTLGLDDDLWAIGSNSLKNYKFDYGIQTKFASRVTVYFRSTGGPIEAGDRIFGRDFDRDYRSAGGGSSATAEGEEVFRVLRNGAEQTDFCSVHRPTSNTTFGVYSLIGNDLVYKINPSVRPAVTIQTKPKTKDGRVQINCPVDEEQKARREKMAIHYSSRSGVIAKSGSLTTIESGGGTVSDVSHNQTLTRGDYVRYKLFSGATVEVIGPKLRLKNAKKNRQYVITNLGQDPADIGTPQYTTNTMWGDLTGNYTPSLGDIVTIQINPQKLYRLTELEPSAYYRIQEDNPEAEREITNGFAQRVNYKTRDKEVELITNDSTPAAGWVIGKAFQTVSNYVALAQNTINVSAMTTATNGGFRYEITNVGTTNMDKGWYPNEDGNGDLWARLSGVYGSLSVEDNDTREDVVYVGDIIKADDPDSLNLGSADGVAKPYLGPMQVRRRWGQASVQAIRTEQELADISDGIASRQKSYDQGLIVGEVYKIGTAYGVCIQRTENSFISVADKLTDQFGSDVFQDVTADFYITEAGACSVYPSSYLNTEGDEDTQRSTATSYDHILRVAQAVVANTRPCSATEFGFRSSQGIRINGLCNFRDTKSFQFADEAYCEAFRNEEAEDLDSQFYQSSTVTSSEQRYSFFTVQFKDQDIDLDGDWIELTDSNNSNKPFIFGMVSETQQAQLDYLRLEFYTGATPDVKQRIFRFRPLAGYEIRTASNNPDFYILDAKDGAYPTITTTISTQIIKCNFNGYKITWNQRQEWFGTRFSWNDTDLDADYTYTTKKTGDGNTDTEDLSGLPTVDDDINIGSPSVRYANYIDKFGKLAEAFAYDEITSSAATTPEHEIVYVNEIVPNDTAPTYENMALVGINIRASQEWSQFTQFSAYAKKGIRGKLVRQYPSWTDGGIDLFPDVLHDLLLNQTYGMGKYIKEEMIDLYSFKDAADFCATRGDHGYRFNGVIAEQVNLRQYAADVAATNLLYFAEINGKFTLKPYFATDGSGNFTAVDIKALFTVGNILEDTYKVSYLTPEEREPIQVSVQYRQERASTDPDNEGAFAVVRSVLVRESNVTYEPFVTETLDMSDYCTTEEHAIDAAKFLIRMRRIPDHTITFKTGYDAIFGSIAPGDYVKVALDATDYDDFNNGVVTTGGELISTKGLSNGSYSVYAWDPNSGNDPYSTTLTVSGGGTTATPTGILFTEIQSGQASRTYQIERITADQDGTFTIEALHMPVNSSGIPEAVVDFDNPSAWTLNNA